MGVELMKNYLLAFLGGDYDMEEQQANNGKELLEAVHTARQEWVAAQSYFENVSDPELVDYAIFKQEAAKRKYMYLLNLARKEGLADSRIVQEINKAGQS
jgi:hypothetical protein